MTANQRLAAGNAIKALRKLKAAVEIGISLNQYTDRLLEAKVEIEALLNSVPTGTLRLEIASALEAFQDAHELWRIAVREVYVTLYLLNVRSILQKYGPTQQDISEGVIREKGDIYLILSADLNRIPADARLFDRLWQERYFDPPLKGIWAIALQHLKQSEEAFK